MKRDTALIRLRFPFPMLERIDRLCKEIRALVQRRVPRARLVRALVALALQTELAPELAAAVNGDPIRRGREKGYRARRATS